MSNQKQWESQIKQGQRAYQRQCFAEAERHLCQALNMAEKSDDKGELLVTSLSEMATFYRISGDLGKAGEMISKAVAVGKQVLNRRELDLLLRKEREILQEAGDCKRDETPPVVLPLAQVGQ